MQVQFSENIMRSEIESKKNICLETNVECVKIDIQNIYMLFK